MSLHRAVLADARRADHRAQSPLGRLRRDLRAVHRLPRLQQHHRQGQGDHRPHPAGQRLRHLLVRQGPQHAGVRRPARSGRSTSGRPAWASSISTASSAATPTSGSRTCSATRRRSIRSRASPGWNLVTGDGRRRHRLHEAHQPDDPSKPFFIKYAPGATHAPHHPTKEWVDKIRAMHLFDDGWNKLRERIFENQKRLGVIPQDTQAEPWPNECLKNWDELHGRGEEALHPPGRGLRRLRGLQRLRNRPRHPGRSRTWASSTTR